MDVKVETVKMKRKRGDYDPLELFDLARANLSLVRPTLKYSPPNALTRDE